MKRYRQNGVMNKETEHLVLEHLRRIRDVLDVMQSDIQDLKIRMTAVEENVGQLFVMAAAANKRMDRIDERLGRIEKRLDLVEA